MRGSTGGGIPDAPTTTSTQNTGLQTLPPARPGMDSYKQEAAITGPIYRYDGMSNSTVKLPPHFDCLWPVADFQNNEMDTIRVNAAGTAIGPDGVLYILNCAGWFGATAQTGIVRIEYTAMWPKRLGAVPACISPGWLPMPG